MKYTIVFIAGLYASVVFTSCTSRAQTDQTKEDIIPVKLMALQQQTTQQAINASGQFSTDDETNLSFKSGGIVQAVLVKEGDAIKKGQLLATLNQTEINASVEQASLAYQKAQRDYQRASNLYRDSVATLEQMQNAKTAMEVAKQQFTSAGFNQRYAEIRATRNGYVLKKYLNDGQYAAAGSPVLQVNGAGDANWVLKVGVSDYQWAAISVGNKATVSTDATPGKLLNAVVARKSEGVDPASGTFVVQLKLTEQHSASIASGLFGKAAIQPTHSTAAWTIPYDALLDGDANQGYVFVTNDNTTAQKVKVQVSKIESGKVIVASGLEQVKSLIISGSAYLNDGSKINVITQ